MTTKDDGIFCFVREHHLSLTFHSALLDNQVHLHRVQQSGLNIWNNLQNGVNYIECMIQGIKHMSIKFFKT